jgi:hypothetical protein
MHISETPYGKQLEKTTLSALNISIIALIISIVALVLIFLPFFKN